MRRGVPNADALQPRQLELMLMLGMFSNRRQRVLI